MYYCRECSNSPLVEYDATRLQCPKCQKLYSNPNPQPKLDEVRIPFVVEEINDEIDEHIIDTNLEEVDENEVKRKQIIELFWLKHADNFDEKSKDEINAYFQKSPLTQLNYVANFDFKSSKTAKKLAIFLGWSGIPRLYIGDTVSGLCILLFGWLLDIVFWIYDICKIEEATKKKNHEKFRELVLQNMYMDSLR